MKSRLFLMLFILLLSSGVTSAQEGGVVEQVPCPFEIPDGEVAGETIDCLVVTVPESRAGLSENVVELAVVVLYARGEEQIAPIFHLAGGPGNSGTAFVWDFLDHPLRDVTSLILFDQRGTGYSYPSLDCTGDESDEEIQACYESLLEAGVVLDAYRTEENAADVNDVITALGLESVTIYGISYGSRLALTVMKDPHPAIYSVILDGVYPPIVLAYEEDPINIARVFEAVIDGCAQDAACNEKFPNLENAFVAAVDGLNEESLIVGSEELTGDGLVDTLFGSFYDTDSIPFAPAVIYAALNRDAHALTALLYAEEEGEAGFGVHRQMRGDTSENDGNSEGMFKSVECADEMPFNTLEGIEAAVSTLDLPTAWAESLYEGTVDTISMCEIWVVTPSDPSVREAVYSDLPTLLLNGDYDPVTPPHWAEIAAETLSNSTLFIVPGGGHGVMDMNDCTLGIVFAFLTNPETAPDGSCVAEIPPPGWFLDYP